MRSEKEFNSQIYNHAVFAYKLEPNSDGRYSVDTPLIMGAIGLKKKNHGYNGWNDNFSKPSREYRWVTKGVLCKWFDSKDITVSPPVLNEIYGLIYDERVPEFFVRETWLLLNRPNVRLLVTQELDRKNWQKTLSQYAPDVVEKIKPYIGNGISSYDANALVISACEHQTLVTFDIELIKTAFQLGLNIHDFRVNTHLP